MPNKPKIIWTVCPICKRPNKRPASDHRKGYRSCSRKCATKINPFRPSKFGEENQAWKGGRVAHARGYIYKYAPDHPRASSGYVFEHILIAEEMLGRYLLPGETVHHINGIRDDNRPENIHVFETPGEHSKHHAELRRKEKQLAIV